MVSPCWSVQYISLLEPNQYWHGLLFKGKMQRLTWSWCCSLTCSSCSLCCSCRLSLLLSYSSCSRCSSARSSSCCCLPSCFASSSKRLSSSSFSLWSFFHLAVLRAVETGPYNQDLNSLGANRRWISLCGTEHSGSRWFWGSCESQPSSSCCCLSVPVSHTHTHMYLFR